MSSQFHILVHQFPLEIPRLQPGSSQVGVEAFDWPIFRRFQHFWGLRRPFSGLSSAFQSRFSEKSSFKGNRAEETAQRAAEVKYL